MSRPTSGTTDPRSRVVTPVISAPEAQRVIPFLGQRYHIRVSGEDTAGSLALMDTSAVRGHGSPMHVHRHDYEIFVVLEGMLRVIVDGQEHRAGAGCAAVLPAGRPHGFVVTSESARYLTVHHGPAFEQFIAAVSDEGVDIPDAERLTEIAAAHGIDILGPPPAP
jgi:quercetin dioxygenase-like cupin family protein